LIESVSERVGDLLRIEVVANLDRMKEAAAWRSKEVKGEKG
jgi:hypothetical protein